MAEAVNHPAHYNTGSIEVIDAIEDWQLDFNRGNCVKYVARAGRKPGANELEDLKKAAWYLQRAIKSMAVADIEDTQLMPAVAPPPPGAWRDTSDGPPLPRNQGRGPILDD